MTPLQRLLREPALGLAVLTELMALGVAFGVHLSDGQTAAVLAFVGGVAALLRYMLTPSSEVVAQQRPGEPVKATSTAEKNFGLEKDAVVAVDLAV